MHQTMHSEQSSTIPCNTEDLWIMHQNEAILEQGSKILCNTDELELCIKTKRFQN